MTEAQFNAGIVGALIAVGIVCLVGIALSGLRRRIRLSIRQWRDIRIPKMERRYINWRKRVERRRRVAAQPSRNTVHVEHDPNYVPEWMRARLDREASRNLPFFLLRQAD